MTHPVEVASPRGSIRYTDSRDHFENGLLRLLGLDLAAFDRWLALAEDEPGDLLERLGRGFARLRPIAPGPPSAPLLDEGPDGVAGRVLHASIAESPGFGVARSRDGSIGWLVRRGDAGFRRELSPPIYEEAYFHGDRATSGGYGDYAAQAVWRLEKSRRQVGEVAEATGITGGRPLDVGSGYGFFRRALAEAGFEHDGLEISAHARDVARGLYGFATLGTPIEELAAERPGHYDLVTLWDVIEHVADAALFLGAVAALLRPGGAVAIKTPNLDCPEAEVFGPHYHSLKREHLVYFTPISLEAAAVRARLDPILTTSTSHLLVGFVGSETTATWARERRGADLVVYLRRR